MFDQAPALYTPDGLQLVLGAQRGLVVLGNDGEIAREIPLPQGYEACIPRRWWSDRVALVVCTMLKPITHNLWVARFVGDGCGLPPTTAWCASRGGDSV